MKKILSILLSVVCLSASGSYAPKTGKSPQEIYIEQFSSLAVEEMYRSGIPASITLAQGLLESRYGLSELAVKGNNHFGIKCHNNWKGKTIYYDDDRRGECFRAYASPEQSYKDHSDFLRYRDRYRFLFDFEVTDYKSWAHGLKKAGYATDPAYPTKLIRLIEDYKLHEFDVMSRSDRKPRRLPQSPAEIEQTESLTQEERADFHFSISRTVYSRNGVPFVTASEGETYSSIAASNNLFLREIFRYNDADPGQTLEPGSPVYLKPKKKQAVKGLEKHVVEEGETMRGIAQRYGIRLKNLYKMNGMTEVDVPREGDIIKLRK